MASFRNEHLFVPGRLLYAPFVIAFDKKSRGLGAGIAIYLSAITYAVFIGLAVLIYFLAFKGRKNYWFYVFMIYIMLMISSAIQKSIQDGKPKDYSVNVNGEPKK